MKESSLLFLRVSTGLLMVFWGVDKLVNVEHGIGVSESFYLGFFSAPLLLQAFGVSRSFSGSWSWRGSRAPSFPALLAITAATALGVWKSIIDPWGWFLEGSNVLFYPTLIILAASLVLWAFREEDTLALDRRNTRSGRSIFPGR